MDGNTKSSSEAIIANNPEEWNRLLFLLQDPEPNVFWINCDSAVLKKPLHDALALQFPQLIPYDIYVDEKTESLTKIILWDEKDKITKNGIIHILGMDDAVKNTDFLANLNFQRDSLFRQTPAHIIFWSDFETATVLSHKTYDFWSWVVFSFNFTTPKELLTARQKGFETQIDLEDTVIPLPHKDSKVRIQHLEDEWQRFLKSVNGKPSTAKQMKDAVAIALALAREYRDEEEYIKAISILQETLDLNSDILSENSKGLIINELGLVYGGINDYENAISFTQNALRIVKSIYGDISLNTATVQSNLGVLYSETGQLKEARSILENSIGIYNEIHDSEHPNKLRDEINLATVYLHLNEYEKAKDLLENVLNFYINFEGGDSPILAKVYSNLSVAYKELGNYRKAQQLLEKSISVTVLNFGDHNLRIAVQYNNLAYIYLDLGDYINARHYMEKAYAILKSRLGNENPKTKNAFNFLQQLEQK